MGKGEIARYEQFLFFPHCFQKTCTADTLKQGLVWKKGAVSFNRCNVRHDLTLLIISCCQRRYSQRKKPKQFNPLPHKAAFSRTRDIWLWKTLREKEKNACNKQFFLFSQCFLSDMALYSHFKCTLNCRLQLVSIWTNAKICRQIMSQAL